MVCNNTGNTHALPTLCSDCCASIGQTVVANACPRCGRHERGRPRVACACGVRRACAACVCSPAAGAGHVGHADHEATAATECVFLLSKCARGSGRRGLIVATAVDTVHLNTWLLRCARSADGHASKLPPNFRVTDLEKQNDVNATPTAFALGARGDTQSAGQRWRNAASNMRV
eukprot:14607891-Alexandrium_andersonii.AAC.2